MKILKDEGDTKGEPTMCRRKSKAMDSISAMCVGQNIEPDVLFQKAKLVLGAYRRVCWASLGTLQIESDADFYICDDDIGQALDYLNNYSPNIDRHEFERNLKMLFDSRWMVELFDDTMIQVKEFPDGGDTYFDILSKAYLSKFKYSESDMLDMLRLERSTYYDRKKEAILVFGLALWGTVLPKLSLMLQQAAEMDTD